MSDPETILTNYIAQDDALDTKMRDLERQKMEVAAERDVALAAAAAAYGALVGITPDLTIQELEAAYSAALKHLGPFVSARISLARNLLLVAYNTAKQIIVKEAAQLLDSLLDSLARAYYIPDDVVFHFLRRGMMPSRVREILLAVGFTEMQVRHGFSYAMWRHPISTPFVLRHLADGTDEQEGEMLDPEVVARLAEMTEKGKAEWLNEPEYTLEELEEFKKDEERYRVYEEDMRAEMREERRYR